MNLNSTEFRYVATFPSNGLAVPVCGERLDASADHRKIDDQLVPDRTVVSALVVVRQGVQHPLDQGPWHLGMPAGRGTA